MSAKSSRGSAPYRLSEPSFGGGGQATSTTPTAVSDRGDNEARNASDNPAHLKLSKMSPAQRNTTMTQYMKASGYGDCVVSETFFQGTVRKTGDAFWNVRCSNKKAFAVNVSSDSKGSTSILDCAALKAITKVECFKKFD